MESKKNIIDNIIKSKVNTGGDDYSYDGEHDVVLKRSNVLIESRYHASLLETKIMALGLSKLQLRGAGSEAVSFSVTELRDFVGARDNSYFYGKLKNAAKGLVQNYFIIEDPKTNSFLASSIVINAAYSNGVFAMEFNKSVRPFIFQLKNNYTKMSMNILMSFDNNKKSNSAYRIYELLKEEKYKITKERPFVLKKFALAEFIAAIGLIDLSDSAVRNALERTKDWNTIVYDIAGFSMSWGDLERRVIRPAKEEINRITDIRCEYTSKGKGIGGRTAEIIFKIEDNPDYKPEKEVVTDNTPDEALIIALERLVKERLSMADKIALLEAAEGDLERIGRAYQLAKKQRGRIDNLVAWMVAALKGNWENNRPIVSYGNPGERPFEDTLALQEYIMEMEEADVAEEQDPEQDLLLQEWEKLISKK